MWTTFRHQFIFIFVDKKLPLLVFGVLSIVGGFLALPLPETRHRPLPETIDDVEHYEEFCRFVLVWRSIKFTFHVFVNNNKDRRRKNFTLCWSVSKHDKVIRQGDFLKFSLLKLSNSLTMGKINCNGPCDRNPFVIFQKAPTASKRQCITSSWW